MISDLNRLIEPSTVRAILAVHRAGSFTKAAADLGISQPSISQKIKSTEESIGRKLFKRSRSGVELTVDGKAVIVYAHAILRLTGRLQEKLERAEVGRELAVGMSEDFCRTALSAVLRLFMIFHPNIRLHVLSGTYEMISEAIQDGLIEIAVIRKHDMFPRSEPLFRDQLVWFGSSSMPLPIPDPVPLVLPLATNPSRDTVLNVLRSAGRRYVIRFESIGIAGMEMAIGAGLGVCAGPNSMPLFTGQALSPLHGLPALPEAEFIVAQSEMLVTDIGQAFKDLLKHASNFQFSLTSPNQLWGLSPGSM